MKKLIYTLTFMVVIIATSNAQGSAPAIAEILSDFHEDVITTSEVEEIEEETGNKVSISGFVDGYYMYNLNETGFPTSFTELHNSFNIGMANVVFSKEGKVGFVADLAVGPRAEVANGYGGSTLSAIKQLFVTYSPSDKVTLTFGNFGTFVGYEVIDAPVNVNYSTSYMFSNGPFYHTGLKADFALGESFGAMVGIFNDTDAKFDEVAGKHIGVQLSTKTGDLSAYLNFLYGKEDVIEEKDQTGYQVDLTASYSLSNNVMLGLNATSKSSSLDGTTLGGFTGAALYSTIGLSETFALGLRAEYFGINDGSDATDDDNVLSFTASGNILIGDLILIPEFRYDISNSDFFFIDSDGEFVSGNGALILAAVYSF